MKKTVCILLGVLMLCGCGYEVNLDAEGEKTTQAVEDNTNVEADATDNENTDDIEFSQNDFVLYAANGDELNAVIWLGMERGYVEDNMTKYGEYFMGIDTVSYNTQTKFEDDEPTDEQVDYTSLISYTGSKEYLETEKGIRTSGLYDMASKPNSTADEVIEAYGLNPENESIYIGSPDDDNYTIVVYFSIDNHNNVRRVVSSAGSDVSDITQVKGADYFLKFMITNNEVSGIQMYRQRPIDAK